VNIDYANSARSLEGQVSPRKVSFLLYLVLFLGWGIVTFAFLLPDGFDTTFSYCCQKSLSVFATNAQIQEYFGLSDAGSYAHGGALLLKTGSHLPPGGAPLWSPGMFLIHAAILKVVGLDGPASLGLALLAGLSWTAFCTLLSAVAYQMTARTISLLTPAVLFLFPATRDYLLGVGIFYSEPISVALFGAALLLAAASAMQHNWRKAVASGIAFAAAAYVRSTFEIVMHPAAMLLIVCSLASLIIILLNRRKISRSDNSGTLAWLGQANGQSFADLKIVAIIFMVFYSLTIPYRLMNLERYGRASWDFADYYFAYPWLPDSEFTPGQNFILRGGGNTACRINKPQCDEFAKRRNQSSNPNAVSINEYKSAFYRTAISSPFAWLRAKAPVIIEFWFSMPTFGPPVQGSYRHGILAAAFIMISILVAAYLLIRHWLFWPAIFIGGYLGGSLVIWNLVHLEVRYIYPVQALSPVLAIIALGALLSTLPTRFRRPARRNLIPFHDRDQTIGYIARE